MPDLSWLAVAIAFAIVGGGLIIWACLRARIGWRRRARRCSKCRYDLSHTDGLRCAECGFVATRERQLHRPQWRWWPAVVGVVLLLAALPMRRVPEIRQRGWAAAEPTTGLILALPWIEPAPAPRGATRIALLNPGCAELLRRCASNLPARWQWRLMIEHIVRDDEPPRRIRTSMYQSMLRDAQQFGHLTLNDIARADATSCIDVGLPDHWPSGVPVVRRPVARHWADDDLWYEIRDARTGELLHRGVYVHWARISNPPEKVRLPTMTWQDHLTELGQFDDGPLRVSITIEAQPEESGARRHVRTYEDVLTVVGGPVDECVTTVQSEAVAEVMGRSLRPSIRAWPNKSWLLQVHLDAVSEAADDAGCPTLALRFEVLRGHAVIASAFAWWRGSSRVAIIGPGGSSSQVRVRPEQITLELSPGVDVGGLQADDLRVRISGDPVVALRGLEPTRYWSGTVVVPVERDP